MKEILVEHPDEFDLVDVVEKFNRKLSFKELLKEHKILEIFIVLSTFVSIFFNTGSGVLNVISILARWIPINIAVVLLDKHFNKKKAEKILENSLYCEDGLEEELSVFDYKDAVIYSRKPILETYYLCNEEATKVNSKKVVSYIALTKKEKLIIFKQILSDLKFESDKIKDTKVVKISLLEKDDLEKERILNFNGSFNKTNPLIKKLISKKII